MVKNRNPQFLEKLGGNYEAHLRSRLPELFFSPYVETTDVLTLHTIRKAQEQLLMRKAQA